MTDLQDPANSESWAADAHRYREVLKMLGHKSPDCMPGEPEECGGTYAEHCIGYLGALKARVQFGINHLDCSCLQAHHASLEAAQGIYEHWLGVYEEKEGCGATWKKRG